MSDREEGEIVDDDFEDISDNSIIDSCCTPAGKSVSSKDNLRALSLSSLTDFDEKVEPSITIQFEEKEKTESHSQKRIRKRPSKPKPRQARKRRRSYRKPVEVCSDSEGEDYRELNRRLQQQLKAAVHVNREEEAHKNSLRTRLKAMTNAPLEPEENHQELDNTNLDTNTIVTERTPEELNKGNHSEPVKGSNDDDTELMQLRLEALRTAVVNKFKDRKKRKVAEVSADESDTNKENANSNIEDSKKAPVDNDKLTEEYKKDNKLTDSNSNIEDSKKAPVDNDKLTEEYKKDNKFTDSATTESNKNIEEATPEEDEDILRAHLLASMSKKLLTMTKSTEDIIPKSVTSTVPVRKPIVLRNNIPQKIVNNVQSRGNNNFKVNNMVVNKNKVVRNVVNVNNKVLPVPQVKPFIIQVSADSDSEDDTLNKTVSKNTEITTNIVNKKTQITSNNVVTLGIESTVDKFLREQRAKVEAELKINGASIQAPLKAVNNCLTKPVNNALTTLQKSPVMEKSAVKLLPKSKQIEYQKLLLRIKNAEKRPRLRKTSHRVETKVVANVTKSKLLNKSKVVNKLVNAKLDNQERVVNKLVNAKLDKNQERVVNKLVTAKLDKSQERRTEALLLHNTLKEMQEVVDQRLQIRDKYKVLRPLVKNVNEASKERRKHEQEVKRLLEQLTEAKRKQADAQEAFSMFVKKLVTRKDEIDKRCSTPTPITPSSRNHFTSTPIREKASVTPLEISSIPNSFLEIPLPLDNTLDLQKLSGSQLSDVNVGDPNDIDMIISKEKSRSLVETSVKTSSERNARTSSFLKYESPLVIVKSSETSDPFSILCPFEVDGTCKDNECTYKHFLKR